MSMRIHTHILTNREGITIDERVSHVAVAPYLFQVLLLVLVGWILEPSG